MTAATWHSIYTVILFVVIIGVMVWAYSKRRKADFDEASRLPLDDDHPHGYIQGSAREDKK